MSGLGKRFVQTQLASADPADHKSSVRVVSSSPLPSYNRVANVITAAANGALPAIDSVTLIAGQSFLLKDGADGSDNGIYVVTQVGSGGTPFILTRRSDADTDEFVNCGMRVPVEEGSFTGREFVLVTPNPIVLNTTDLEFVPGGGGGNGSLTTIDSSEQIAEGHSMLHSGDVTVEDGGELDLEGSTEDIEHFQNHSISYVPYRSTRVVQKDETMHFTKLVVDGTLVVDGLLEDITPEDPPEQPTVGELGGLVITDQPSNAFDAEAGKLYRISQAFAGEVEVQLPDSPSDGDTVGFYILSGFVELELELNSDDANVSADGHALTDELVLVVDGGDILFVSYNAVLNTWDVYGSPLNSLGGVRQTTDATPVTAAAHATVNDNTTIGMHIEVLARDNGNNLTGHWIAEVTARRDGGSVVTVLEDLFLKAYKDNANWDVQFNVVGQEINVDVIGDVGNTVDWRVRGKVKGHV